MSATATSCAREHGSWLRATAYESWNGWAGKNGISDVTRGFARFRQNVFTGEDYEFIELQQPTPRTFTTADRLAEHCDSLDWGSKVIEPLIFGAVGQVAGREWLAYRDVFKKCPTPEQIEADPDGAALPDEFGVCFALGQTLTAVANNDGQERTAMTAAFARYVTRWPEEQQSHWFRSASRLCPSVVHTAQYKEWERQFRV